jgi:preprotein translocase subunit SecB
MSDEDFAETIRRSGLVGAVAQLHSIVLREIHWKLNELPTPITEQVQITVSANLGHGRSAEFLRYQLGSTVEGSVSIGTVFKMESKHDAAFILPTDASFDDGELEAFGQTSVFLMLFPYLRQTLQIVSAQAGLPSVTLAPVRLPLIARPDPESSRGTEKVEWRSKYVPLRDYLREQTSAVAKLSFAEIERILGAALPASAREHQAWWANEKAGTHDHARAWLDAGRKTQRLDLNAQTVEFSR